MAIIDELIEKAFCDGYEYAQREYANKNSNVTWKKIKEAAKKVGKKLKENAEGYETPKPDKTITLNPNQMKNFMAQRGYSFNSFIRNRFAGDAKFLRGLRDFRTDFYLGGRGKYLTKAVPNSKINELRPGTRERIIDPNSAAYDTVKVGKWFKKKRK